MSLANGRPYLAIPGPSTIPDRVLNAMHRAAPNIYAGDLHALVAGLWPDLRRLAGTSAHIAMYIVNGHGAWEAANANMFSRGDRALVLATGAFGLGWANAARAMGVAVDVLDFGTSAPVDLAQLEAALRADVSDALTAALYCFGVNTPVGLPAAPAARSIRTCSAKARLIAFNSCRAAGLERINSPRNSLSTLSTSSPTMRW